MFFALSILFITVFLFNLEVVVCAIIIKNFIVSLPQEETVFVNFRLYKITLFCKDRKGAVDIMEFIGWCLQELLCSLERRSFAGRLQDSGVDQVREDRIQVIFKFVTVSDLSADGIHLQTIIDRLEEEITASKKFFSVIVHKSVEWNGIVTTASSVSFLYFSVSILACSFAHAMTPSRSVPRRSDNSARVPSFLIVVEVLLP